MDPSLDRATVNVGVKKPVLSHVPMWVVVTLPFT